MMLPIDPLTLARIIQRTLNAIDRKTSHTVALQLSAMWLANVRRWPRVRDWSAWNVGWITVHFYEVTPSTLLVPSKMRTQSRRAVLLGRVDNWELIRLDSCFAISRAKQHQWVRVETVLGALCHDAAEIH